MGARSLSAELVAYIEGAIERGGSARTGRTIHSHIDYAVRTYLRTATGRRAAKPINTISDLVFNMVNAHVRDQEKTNKVKKERTFGTLLVTDSDIHQGWLQEEQKVVVYQTKQEVYTGEEVPYRLERGKYILEKAFSGKMKKQYSQNYADASNAFARKADTIDYAQFESDFTTEATWVSGGSISAPAGEQIWIQDDVTFAYFDGSTYTETSGYPTADFTVDCSAYFSNAAAGIPVSNGGISYTKYPGLSKAMKVLFYGKYRICLVGRFYYTENNSDTNDWYESGVFELIVIDSETQAILFAKTLSHTPFSSLVCPAGFYGGYVDIKVNMENGKLLLLTGGSPTTTTIGVKYYNEADPTTDPQIYDHTTNATVYRMPFDLDEVVINDTETDFDVVQNLYTHNGVVSTVDGVSCTGGITSTMFTQQPESYKIFLNRHLYVFKQQVTVPVTADDVRWAYQLCTYGRFEFYDLTLGAVSVAPETYKTHSTACSARTTTAITDMAVAVVDLQPTWTDGLGVSKSGRFEFIETWLPGTDRHAVVGQDKFYEHGGANYAGRPDNDNPYYTYSGNSTITRDYAAAEASHLHEDRFIAITDDTSSLIKYLWYTRVELHYHYVDNSPVTDTKHYGYYQEQGYTFWRNDPEALEMTLLDAENFNGSQRYNGGFVNDDDPTLIEYTMGYNNAATFQITDDTFLVAVSRAERVDYLNSGDWTTRAPSEVHYDFYVAAFLATNGGLTSAQFPGEAVTSHDLVAVGQLETMEARRALVALFLA